MASFIALVLAISVTSATGAASVAFASSREQALVEEWSRELAPETKVVEYKSPIKRVVGLLRKMQSQLEAEASKESEMYDEQVCWCKTNEKEKTKAIADAEARDLDLSAEIKERAAQVGVRETEVARLKKQIGADTEALKEATSIREGEAGEFRGEEKDLVQAIDNLRNAVAVLGRHQGSNFLQLDAPLLSGIRMLLRDAALKYEMLVGDDSRKSASKPLGTALLSLSAGTDRGKDHESLLSALDIRGSAVNDFPLDLAESLITREAHNSGWKKTSGTFLQASDDQPGMYKSYSARSDGIYGIMTQMLEEFEAQLKKSQKDEVSAATDYDEIAKSKEKQIAVAKEKLDDIEGAHAENQKALSDAKEDLELTRQQRSDDVEFLRNVKLVCQDLDKQWELRSKTRSAESVAVADTIAILTEDDNREMLFKTVTFLQENADSKEGVVARARRSRAAMVLRRSAQDPSFNADDLLSAWHNHENSRVGTALSGPRAQLSTLAVSVQLDAFTKVKEIMDKMVAELKKQQQDEVDFKAYCRKELDVNEKAAFNKNEEKQDLEARLESLSRLVDKLQTEINDAKEQIVDTQTGIKKSSQARERENAEFQTTIADQRATQAILKKALERLKDFYTKGIGKEVFVQKADQTPPVQFNKYSASAGSSPVMGLISDIIEDAKQLESEATSSEYKAQADYESFVKDSNTLVGQLSASVTAKTKAIAIAKQDTAQATDDHNSAVGELESLADYEADLHNQCDFVMKNFDVRQKARLQEMEAIQQAKAILSGDSAN